MVDERRGYGYVMWYDLETGGGACRIVWRNGITWVSHHGGYSRSIDITAEVSQLLREAGAIEFASGREPVCPYKCGTRDSDDSLAGARSRQCKEKVRPRQRRMAASRRLVSKRQCQTATRLRDWWKGPFSIFMRV